MPFEYKLSACLLMKNERAHIDDWLDHYVTQGVDHFFIVSNNSSDGTEEHLAVHPLREKITWIADNREMDIYSNPEQHKEILSDNFTPLIKDTSEWCILVDIDEFMYGRNGHTLRTYVDSLDGTDITCVYVYWTLMKPATDSSGEIPTLALQNPTSDYGFRKISEVFDRTRSTQRLNLDCIHELPWEIRFASFFGKSLFQPAFLSNERKLWMHKVFTTAGKMITNYNTQTNCGLDNREENMPPITEDLFEETDIGLKHYAIRNKGDYESKYKQMMDSDHRRPFVKGLLDMCSLDESFFVEHTDAYTKPHYNLAFYTYGDQMVKVTPSISYDCYYFTDNLDVLEHLRGTSWKGVYSENPSQCKVVPREYKELRGYSYLCFLDDHEKNISERKVERWIDRHFVKGGHGLVVKEHWFKSAGWFQENNVWNEYNVSMRQKHYLDESHRYRKYIQQQLGKGMKEITEHHAECGLLLRDMNHPCMEDLDRTWNQHVEECGAQHQIAFFFVKQLFEGAVFFIK